MNAKKTRTRSRIAILAAVWQLATGLAIATTVAQDDAADTLEQAPSQETPAGFQADDPQAREQLKAHLKQVINAVQPLLIYNGRGSLQRQVGAFRVKEDQLVTSASALAGCDHAAWELGPGRSVAIVGVAALDLERGVALLKLDLTAGLENLPPILSAQPRTLRSGPMIGALGISLTMAPFDQIGHLAKVTHLPGLGRLGYVADMQLPGLEGGPVFSQDGALIGLLGQAFEGDKRIVIPIRSVLEAKQYDPALPLNQALPAPNEAAEEGRLLLISGKATAAAAKLANVEGPQAAFWRGLAQAATDQNEAAIESLEIAATALQSVSANLALAIQYQRAQQDSVALGILRKTQGMEPDSPAPRFAIAKFFHSIDKDTEALQSLKQALNRDSAHVEAMALRGQILVERKRLSEAMPYFKQALAIDPYSADALVGRGQLLLAQDRQEEALASIRYALAVDPDLPQGYILLANALLGLERYDEAIAAAEQTLKATPNSSNAYLTMGQILVAMERQEESLEHFEAATILDPENIEGYLAHGQALKHLRRFREALVPLNKAIAREPRNPSALFNIGFCFLQVGERGKARDSYKVLQHIDGRAARLLFQLIYKK